MKLGPNVLLSPVTERIFWDSVGKTSATEVLISKNCDLPLHVLTRHSLVFDRCDDKPFVFVLFSFTPSVDALCLTPTVKPFTKMDGVE
jgi:hypothetical protein